MNSTACALCGIRDATDTLTHADQNGEVLMIFGTCADCVASLYGARQVVAPSMPPGCVCDPGTWDADAKPPCGEYAGNGVSYCGTCEHDAACHGRGARELTHT